MASEVDAVQALINSDPDIQAGIRHLQEMQRAGVPLISAHSTPENSLMKWAEVYFAPVIQRVFAERGLQMPHDYGISLGQGGRPIGELARSGYWDRNADWLAPAIIGGMGVGAGLLASGPSSAAGAGAGAGAGTAGAVLPSTAAGFTGAGFAAPVAASGTGAAIGAGGVGAAGIGGTLAATTPGLETATLAPTVGASGVGGVGAGGGAVTGGSVLSRLASNPETYSTALGLLGRLGEGQAGERGAENTFALQQEALRNSQFNTQQTAASRAKEDEEAGKIARSQLGISAPSARAHQALLGSLIRNIQPVSFSNTGRVHVPTVSGGLTPAAIDAGARGAGGELERQAIDALLSKSDIPSSTDFSSALMTPPAQTPYQDPGTGESVLSGIGTAANITQAILASLKKKSAQPSSSIGATPSDENGWG